jgi:predicted amidohydrolase
MDPLRIATLAFAPSADARANKAAILAGLELAARKRTQLLATPECSLCGYPAATGAFTGTDCQIAEYEEELLMSAGKLGLVLVLGSTAPDGRGGFLNLAVAGGAVPVQRLAKRVLAPADRPWFAAGPARTLVLRLGAWQVAVGICYEIRQARWWYEAAAAGADAAVVIAHQAGADPDPGTKAAVLPALHAARAAELAMPVVLANTAAPDRWLDSAAWDARGMCMQRLGEGLMLVELAHRSRLDPWYEGVRRDALAAWR